MPTITQILDSQQRTTAITFISSYIPRKCGIATFTKDLTKAVNDLNPDRLVDIIAIDPGQTPLQYPWEVKWKIDKNDKASYLKAAEYINNSDTQIVCLQHEFGLFGGGDAGPYVVDLLLAIHKPIVTTIHTILTNPSVAHRETMVKIAEVSDILVTMLPDGKERLARDYGIDTGRVVIIHHGVTDRPKATKASKKKLGLEDKKVLLISGLIGPNKGVEYAIKALPEIVKEFPEILLVIVGETHPEIVKMQGEAYREQLKELANAQGVAQNVLFINKYLPLDELLSYYDACDIYLTPHTDPQQVTSGTLAYAIGMGKACISTSYIYAKEMLSDGRGMLVDFQNSEQIARAALELLRDPARMAKMESAAYTLGRTMSWPRVAERYLNLFRFMSAAEKSLKVEGL